MDPAVEMRGITKSFPGVVANHSVDFIVEKGEVLGLLGENGAGKTTLMNILYGLYRPDEGEIRVRGETVQIQSPRDAIGLGIGMVHQHFQLVPKFTVAENFLLGIRSSREPLLDNLREVEAKLREFSEIYRLPVDPTRPVWQLSVGEQQRVEILRAIYRKAEILILDEPTSVLTPQEVSHLADVLENLVSMGKSVILITHKLIEVTKMTHRVTVMRDGAVIATRPTQEVTHKELVRMMVGRDVGALSAREDVQPDSTPRLRVISLRVKDERDLFALKNVDLEVKGGEILGIAGVDGNGQVELEESLIGLRPVAYGKILFQGREVSKLSVRDRRALGIAYVPSDRSLRGLIDEFKVSENMVLGQHTSDLISRYGVLNRRNVRQRANDLVDEYNIQTPSIDTLSSKLSGGNAQRLILARELSANPKMILVSQPTRGLDVGATEFVRNRLLECRNQGAAVLLISADLDEIMKLSDRIAVLYEGRIMGTVLAEDARVETIGLMMAGSPLDGQ